MISLSKMQEWFLSQTENDVKKIRAEISKRIDIIKNDMNDLEIAAKDFEVGDTVDAETRSSQNIYEKITEMVQNFDYPEKVTFKTAEDFLKELEKFLERVVTQGKRFIPNLKRKYRTRVFILNRAVQRIQRDYSDLKDFLDNRCSLLKEIDAASDMINIITEKIKERENLRAQIQAITDEASQIQEELSKVQENSTQLETQTVLNDLAEINKDITIIGNKLRLQLNSFDKPLRKLTSRAIEGKVMIPPHLVDTANYIRENPLEVFLKSSEGYQYIKDLMDILIEATKKERIDLKASMKNKTISAAEEVIKGQLDELNIEIEQLKERKKNVEQRVEELGLKDQIAQFKEKEEELEKNEERKERRIRDLKDQLESINKEIASTAADTQREIKRLTNQDIKINIKE